MKRLIVLIVVAALISGCATLRNGDAGKTVKKASEMCWFLPAKCETILLGALGVGALILASKGGGKGDNNQPAAVPVSPTAPVQPTAPTQSNIIPTGNWMYIDDSVLSLDQDLGGDYNSPQDLAAIIAIGVHFNSLPKAIGVTQVKSQIGSAVVNEIVQLSGFNIPIYSGAPTTGSAKSALSDYIRNQARLGEFHLVVGGTTGDVAAAIRELDGQAKQNLKVYLTRNTWNERNSEGATAFVASQVQITQTSRNNLYHMLGVKGQVMSVLGGTPIEFINRHRDLPMWNRANSNTTIAECRRLNTFMSEYEDQNPIRMADLQHALRFFGVPENDRDQHYKIIERGLMLMKARG